MTTAREITRLMGGHWHGAYGMVRCPDQDDRAPSLKICDGPRGPIVHCFAGCTWRAVKDAMRAQGVLDHVDGALGAP